MQARIILPLLLLLSTALSWWFVSSLEFTALDEPPTDNKNPDYFMHGVRTTVMDPNGKPKQELYAQYLAHFNVDNRTELTQPNLTVHRIDGTSWTVKAERGTVYDDKKKIFLQGKVFVEQPDLQSGKSKITIQAKDMTIYPDKHTAETQNWVNISFIDGSVKAIGMHADFKKQLLTLDSKVRGTYVP